MHMMRPNYLKAGRRFLPRWMGPLLLISACGTASAAAGEQPATPAAPDSGSGADLYIPTEVLSPGHGQPPLHASAEDKVQPVRRVPSPSPVSSGSTAQVWEIRANSSLQKTLEAWCKQAGCQLLWNFRDEQTNEVKDLVVGGGMRTTGGIADALRELFKSLDEDARIKAEYRPDNYPPLLYVTRNGVVK